MPRKIKQKIEETVVEAVADVKEELNEPVDTFTVRKSWLIVAAIVATVVIIGVAL